MSLRIDRLGVLVAFMVVYPLWGAFITYRANRIVAGTSKTILSSAPSTDIAFFLAFIFIVIAVLALLKTNIWLRLIAAFVGLLSLLITIGLFAKILIQSGTPFARVSPAVGFWIAFLGACLLLTDSIVRLRLTPLVRFFGTIAALVVLALFLMSGVWNDLSVMVEFQNRQAEFWHEGLVHIILAFGSLFVSILVGLPLGVVIERTKWARHVVLGTLSVVQTIPSIALFGLLIVPLTWIGAEFPFLQKTGLVTGIGMPPAFIALLLYSLLPIVGNTVTGIDRVSKDVINAATGMGLTKTQVLFKVKLPLALAAILSAVRIILVQNIGLATVAALIGGGGFGVFVFQGIGQAAPDLILLGVIPTVTMAIFSAIIMNIFIEMLAKGKS